MLGSYNNSVKCKKRKEDEYEKMEKVYSNGTGGIYDSSVLYTADIVGFRVFRQEVLNQQQMFLKMVPDMRQEMSQEIKCLMRITVEMSLEQES